MIVLKNIPIILFSIIICSHALAVGPRTKPAVQVEGEEADEILNLLWGEEVNGLRAAVEFVPDKESYSLGERVEVRFHVQNVSGHDIQIASTERRQDHAFVTDEEGNKVLVYHIWFSGWPSVVRHMLRPGGTIVLKSYALGFGDADDSALARPITKPYTGNVVRCEPGKFFIDYDIGLPDVHMGSNVDENDNVPQASDWQGSLKTGLREVVITPKTTRRIGSWTVISVVVVLGVVAAGFAIYRKTTAV